VATFEQSQHLTGSVLDSIELLLQIALCVERRVFQNQSEFHVELATNIQEPVSGKRLSKSQLSALVAIDTAAGNRRKVWAAA